MVQKQEQHSTPSPLCPNAQRPMTLLQRISSLIPTLPRRRPASKKRPVSAPTLTHRPNNRTPRSAVLNHHNDRKPLLPPSVTIPKLMEEEDSCPYDPKVYYSFPRIQRPHSRDFLCGLGSQCPLRSPTPRSAIATEAPFRPCGLGRPGTPCKHLTSHRSPLGSRRGSQLSHNIASDASASTTSPSAASGKKRVSFSDLPALDTLLGSKRKSPTARPPTRHGPIPESERGFTFDSLRTYLAQPLKGDEESKPSTPTTPTLPKLHHIHGLPHARDHPYIHRHEVQDILAAGAGGQPSPLTRSYINARPRTASDVDTRTRRPSSGDSGSTGIDYSNTVFYPRNVSPMPATPSSTPQSHAPTEDLIPHRPSQPSNLNIALVTSPGLSVSPSTHLGSSTNPSATAPATIGVDIVQASGSLLVDSGGRPIAVSLELETSDVYRRHGGRASDEPRNEASKGADGSSSSGTAGTSSTVAGQRLELRGGAQDAFVPRLRGGAAETSVLGLRGVGTRVGSVCLAWRLPCSRSCASGAYTPSDNARPVRLSPCPSASSAHGGVSRVPIEISGLRGGAGSAPTQKRWARWRLPCAVERRELPKLEDDDAIPDTLWRAMGGIETPPTVREYKMKRRGRRMGGFLGMAIYGVKAGMPYTRSVQAVREESARSSVPEIAGGDACGSIKGSVRGSDHRSIDRVERGVDRPEGGEGLAPDAGA